VIIFVKSSFDLFEVELAIVNSNRFFNLVSKDKEQLSSEDLLHEINESEKVGAERFVIKDNNQFVGIIEFLMNNPNDGYTWLGLLTIRNELQNKGYGKQALNEFYKIMKERQVNVFRIGVILENEPAHKYWRNQGFMEVSKKVMSDNKEIIVYEKNL